MQQQIPMSLPPDAATYLSIAAGKPGAPPFSWRVGWPWILRRCGVESGEFGCVDLPAWVLRVWPVLVACCGAAICATLGWRSGLLVCALPMVRQWGRWSCMPDAPAFALALVASVTPWWAAIPCALLAGALHERAPVFSALWGWSWLPLVGLVVPLLAMVFARRGLVRRHEQTVVDRPFASAWESVQAAPLWVYVLPWGGCLLALCAPWTWPAITALVVAYAQCVIAVDRARLYQWAAPAVAPLAIGVAGEWWPLVVAGTLAIPWQWAAVAESPWRIVR